MLKELLKNYKITLVSGSERRRQLLRLIDLDFDVSVPQVNEFVPQGLSAEETPVYLAKLKAQWYMQYIALNELVITADTIVLLDNKILGKPADEHEAEEMLRALSGREHRVITGVCITDVNRQRCFDSCSKVWFRTLTSEEIEYYISHYRPFDKAGAYGIQEWIGAVGIEKIQGSYYNVVGLPVERLYVELQKFVSDTGL